MTAKIDHKRLNLIIPVDQGGTTLYVHSTPISREVFETYFEVISKAHSALYKVDIVSGAQIAALTLRKVAREEGIWDGDAGVERGLLGEIKRLTVVLAPGGGNGAQQGWTALPYEVAIAQEKIDDEDAAQIQNALVFFTCGSWMLQRNIRNEMFYGTMRMWGASTSPLTPTEYINSLRTSTKDANSGATVAVSSPTSSIGLPEQASPPISVS